MRGFLILSVLLMGGSCAAVAQETYSAGQMWGTQPSGVAVTGALESALSHVQNGLVAGQVEAARRGLLLGTGFAGSLTIQSIGSQSIVTSSISGNNISSNINADQDSTNSGDVDNNGVINANINGN